jgi:hypothetical protein
MNKLDRCFSQSKSTHKGTRKITKSLVLIGDRIQTTASWIVWFMQTQSTSIRPTGNLIISSAHQCQKKGRAMIETRSIQWGQATQ